MQILSTLFNESGFRGRTGPNRVGPYGVLQPIADAVKLFFKEDFVPGGAHKVLFVLAPALSLFTALATFAVIPFGFQLPLFGRSVNCIIADVNVATRRWADGRYAPEGQHVSFADGFPFLLIGQASIDDLNSRLAQPLPMNRFRPNFVFTGGQPFEEDAWGQIEIGNVKFQCVKPCARCIIPTTDQETAIRAAEPLKTLATFRQVGHKILFGQNVVWLGEEEAWVRKGNAILSEQFFAQSLH